MTVKKLEWIEAPTKKEKPDPNELIFGRMFTDHMFTMHYTEENGWHQPQVRPYEKISLDPASMIFHYGQSVFEGLKAYRSADNEILLFRPEENMKRMNRSNERMSIPSFNEEEMLEYIKQLIEIEKDWVPGEPGTSLYIRPFIIGTEPNLGVHPSHSYQLFVILSPVGSYYPEGINPVKIKVEKEYTRAAQGGTGMAKTGGNYSAGYNAQEKASNSGHAQVLWLDAVEKKYVEEVGSMNIFFKINGEVITPSLSGSILEGVTRKSIIELLQSWGVPVTERKITIDEVIESHREGKLEEAFGAGTAAVVSPIGAFTIDEAQYQVQDGETGELTKALYDTLTGIQTGTVKDHFNWVTEV
ncbi:branched-chain amino acid aminotransferase [Salisediminibacterium halotolerans]|uniref:Branched-chain-amino-acid aminotransferase n=1 Tax=Salisediminibacterium halotolerans TaxID=517425 RepID=A0A1H9RRU0_9BACI|nr:branched-chain amino acid aminotransferase [Salisediminibacterium haloalkalitolerans]SER74639.1 branched-chain amino acid aminotransferase [Salisediminibacterium haloalkalitolerans]